MYKLHLGSNKDVLKTFEDNSVDSIITDPPYEYGFMGKSWDSSGIAYDVELWKECLRVVKPGGYIMAFGSSRTHHRLMVAIEDAGFEIRDTVCWVFGQGFPKSLAIGKKVDEIQGNEREFIEEKKKLHISTDATNDGWKRPSHYNADGTPKTTMTVTKGTSDFEGWGTALKPAVEYICMARKPLSEKTVAENCLKWGTGGINIDESRVGTSKDGDPNRFVGQKGEGRVTLNASKYENSLVGQKIDNNVGRFPANLIHDNSEEVRECFPETKSGVVKEGYIRKANNENITYGSTSGTQMSGFGDHGNASRFFKSIIYQSKPSKAERNRGCEAVFNLFEQSEGVKQDHPTVKPIALMEYLIKMVTPKGGIVLDPFNGSGSTGCAAVKNRFDYIGIDITEDYIKISEKRIKSYQR